MQKISMENKEKETLERENGQKEIIGWKLIVGKDTKTIGPT